MISPAVFDIDRHLYGGQAVHERERLCTTALLLAAVILVVGPGLYQRLSTRNEN